MPPKKASRAGPEATAQVNGTNPSPKAPVKSIPSKSTSAAKTKSTKALTRKEAAASESPLPELNPKLATRGKRKAEAQVEDTEPQTNGVKRRKGSQESDEAAAIPLQKAPEKVSKTAVASKRPKAVKEKIVINHAPTSRLNVYVFGTGDNGELGLGGEKGQTEVKRPRLNPHLHADSVGVVQLAVGGMHSAVLTRENRILTWGINDEGALGRDTTWEAPTRDISDDNSDDDDSDNDSETGINPRESIPADIDASALPEGTVFTQLAAADSATFALTDEGLVYGWGTFRGNDGVLGFTSKRHIQPRPARVEGLKNITKIVCGSNHALALASNGAVFSWGSGQQNQLGRRIVERTRLNGLTPQPFGLPKSMVDIGAGSYHSFAINKNGNVYAWGLNSYGETGLTRGLGEDEGSVLAPGILHSLKGKGKVTCIRGGAHHSVAVTEKGECLVWGRVDAFQTGIKIDTLPEDDLVRDSMDHPRILSVPTRVPGFSAAFATAGSDHCIAISKDGRAFSWGFSQGFQTGQGTDDDIECATQIDNTAVRGKRLVWAGAGGQFSMIAGLADDAPMVNGVNRH